jgi:hypothetical protein
MVKAYLVMVYYHLKSLRSLERFLHGHPEQARWCGLKKIPSYRTFIRRFSLLDGHLQEASRALIRRLVRVKIVQLRMTAIDSSLLQAKGRAQPKKRPDIHPGDPEAKWGFSSLRQWVWGYKAHLFASTKPYPIPVAWMMSTANLQDISFARPLLEQGLKTLGSLFQKLLHLGADKGYDAESLWLWLRSLGLKLTTPIKRLKRRNPHSKRYQPSLIRQFRKRWRRRPIARLVMKRRTEIEHLNGNLKEAFLLDPLPVKGKKAVATWIGLVCVAYQAGVLYNVLVGRDPAAVASIVR